jgi:hypothetical protein
MESWEIFTQRRSGPPQRTGIFDHTSVKAPRLANILNYLRMVLEKHSVTLVVLTWNSNKDLLGFGQILHLKFSVTMYEKLKLGLFVTFSCIIVEISELGLTFLSLSLF